MQYSTTNEKLSSSPLSAAAAAAPPSQQQRQRQHGDKGKDSVFRNLLELFSDGPSLTTATAKEEEDGTTVKGEGHRSSDGKKENKWWGGVKFGVQMSPKEVHIPQGFDWLETPSTNTIFSDVDSSSSSSGIGGIGGIGMVTREMMVHMSELLDRVSVSEVFKQRCEVVQFQTIFNEFRQFIQSRNNFPELYDALLQFNTSIDELVICDFLLPYFTDFAQKRYPQDRDMFDQIKRFADLTDVKRMYPGARNMRRKIYFHAGPTNSGKTHNALQRLKESTHGVYAAPLRLLAQEVYHRLNSEGIKCNLYTGQEVREIPLATHSSCTVEMLDTEGVYEVLVIDEIQLIGDRDRGKAWTKALLGARAAEIHLCGDSVALDIVRKICGMVGEDVEVVTYDRLNELQILPQSLNGDITAIEDQDCIIAFSRREIFNIKRIIEMRTDKKCCVIYGSLPPETRIEQADLFNDPDSGYNILVASDAVGLGLNLNIRRILFHRLHKYDGASKGIQPVDYLLVKQIAGRAGRRKYYDVGMVTTFYERDYELMKERINQPGVPLEQAGIHPDFEQIEAFAAMFPKDMPFSAILERYANMNKVHTDFFLCNYEDAIFNAKLIDHLEMPLKVKYTFVNCPMPNNSPLGSKSLEMFASAYACTNDVVPLDLDFDSVAQKKDIDSKLQQIELFHKIIDGYLWLANKYPLRFDIAFANETKERLKVHLNIGLEETTSMNKLRVDEDEDDQHNRQHRRSASMNSPDELDGVIRRLFN